MAERSSRKTLTTNELIIQKLKETFDRNGNILIEPNNTNVWLMAVAVVTFDVSKQMPPFQPLINLIPTHHVRIVLRTSDTQDATNPYVDGSDFFLTVDEHNQTADFVWEEESFADAPLFHGGEIPSALTWVKQFAEPLLHVCLNDPFLTAAQRLTLNGHDEDYPAPIISSKTEPTENRNEDEPWI
jgi:hypothetical protein